jgi:multidrug efflux pump subunit AcrA (membrane-fusion protein)
VIADNVRNVVTSVGGTLDSLNCQPGSHVTASTVIAKIGASNDVSTQNTQIQYLSLQQQIQNMQRIIALTENNFGVQADILEKQKANNAYLMDNLQQSKDLNADDMNLQVDSLENQQNALEDTQDRDADKMATSIENMRKQLDLGISDALKKVDDVFGILSHAKNASFDQYVSAGDTNLRSKVTAQFNNLYNRYQNIDDISDSEFSSYLSQLSILLKNAALAINVSSASQSLPQSASAGLSIDGLYASYLGLSTSFVASKSSYDTLLASAVSLEKNYTNQLDTLDTSIESFSDNKSELSRIGSDTQIANLTL